MTILEFLITCRHVAVSPFAFFRGMPITDGVRAPVYFALVIYYIRCCAYFYTSYRQGFFLTPEFQVHPVSVAIAIPFLLVSPFFLLLIIYAQSVLLNRIGIFFGGVGNFEGAFKILAYTLFISLFMLIPGVDVIARFYSIIVLLIGIREVFNLDWISSILALFFSFIFTAILYILLFVPPAYLSHMITFR